MTRQRKKDRHLPACVYQKHGAFWYVRNGRWIRLGSNLTEALTEYARLQETPTGGMAKLIDDALKEMWPKLKPNTRKGYEAAAKKLREMLADFSPEQVKPKHIAGIKVALKDTPNMANRVLSVLRSVFALAVEWQIVESNPCVGIRRHVEAKRDRFLTDQEVEAIKRAGSARLGCLIDLLYLTGQRVGDVLAIRLADLGPEGISFRQAKTGTKLLVAWTPDLRDAVDRAKALGGDIRHLTLFHTRRGGIPAYKTVQDEWTAACDKAGVENAHIHDLRAKSLTHARRQGLDATALAGHASKAMTERYIRQRETPVVVGPALPKAGK